ncbi:hypothetical protein [Ciceribacter thiooxidans]|uniref:DUF3828 domain-containing protein n=1 Tax=Ciceribacter thiooxidans TaxID=1969821 RepID=A0ABV7I0V2_9HYPH|nr:hypothetical protein [Ciceribacter thiooxidans]
MKMPRLSFLLALLAAPAIAFAADATAPVKSIMDVAAGNWSETSPTANDVFDNQRLDQLFSADFARTYREASKHPAYDLPEGETTGSPFDYDPIAGGQDGCAFENIRIEDDGDGQVTALFNNRKCLGDDPAYQEDTVLIFHVVEEQGRAVIDDMYRVEDGQSGKSLKDELRDIAGQ